MSLIFFIYLIFTFRYPVTTMTPHFRPAGPNEGESQNENGSDSAAATGLGKKIKVKVQDVAGFP